MHKLSGLPERYENGLSCRENGVRFGAEGCIERGLSDFDPRHGFADGELFSGRKPASASSRPPLTPTALTVPRRAWTGLSERRSSRSFPCWTDRAGQTQRSRATTSPSIPNATGFTSPRQRAGNWIQLSPIFCRGGAAADCAENFVLTFPPSKGAQ